MTDGSRRPSSPDRVPRMRDVPHVHPDHDTTAWHWFARGPTVAADGGEPSDAARTPSARRTDDDRRAAGGREDRRDVEDETLRDVSHEPVHGEGANRVWERGEDDGDGAEE